MKATINTRDRAGEQDNDDNDNQIPKPIKQGTSVRVIEPDTIVPIDFIFNDFEEQEYIRLKKEVPDRIKNSQENVFFSNVDTSKGAIEREVTKIKRIKAIDYSSPKKERKDFLMYYENWHGKDWQGNIIAPVTDHVEGWYQSLEAEPITEKGKIIDYRVRNGPIIYYIPFTKDKVDEIINNSIGTDRESLESNNCLIVQTNTLRGAAKTYEQFVSLPFEELKETIFPTRIPQKK